MNFSDITGKTIKSIEGAEPGSERVEFHFADGTACASVHMQDCCESVDVHRIDGDIANVVGRPILEAEELHDGETPIPNREYAESWTWTRQRIRTESGEVTIIWLGESNGYYGETPYFQITHGEQV